MSQLNGHAPLAPKNSPKVLMRGVSKQFESGEGKKRKLFHALENISLEVHEGEFLTLAGPTGCGKSTILNLIAGFEFPDEGEVLFEGQRVSAPGSERLVLFQEHGLFPWLTVQHNVEFGLRVLGLDKGERRDRAGHYLQMVHLQKFRHSYPFQLSGGMRQRAALARALAVEPQMLLMDEPFASLDPRTRDILHVELQSLWMETHKTIVFVTHSVEEALRLSDRVLVMATQPGRIRKEFKVRLPHPRDFLDPQLAALRAAILKEIKDELNKLMQREGDDDWHL
jgi:NitT/TauT family transport system ATP-binding protein